MASADPFAETPERISSRLKWLRKEWEERVPQYVRDWETWNEDEKLSFVVEAGIREDYLHGAQKWAREGILSEDELRELRCIERIADGTGGSFSRCSTRINPDRRSGCAWA